ncbi:MAG: hypothetical protein WCE79_00040, partial [Xanthobacteraceae bacterium]
PQIFRQGLRHACRPPRPARRVNQNSHLMGIPTDSIRSDFALARSIGKPVEIRIDGRVMSKPVIREPITGGTGQIIGSFTVDEGRMLAERLSSGAGKLELEVVE